MSDRGSPGTPEGKISGGTVTPCTEPQDDERSGMGRREFLGKSARAIAGASGLAAMTGVAAGQGGPQSGKQRAITARDIRVDAAQRNFLAGVPSHPNNGDESLYPGKWGSYSKALVHDQFGQVTPESYNSLLTALRTGRPGDFDQIELGGSRQLTDPQSALGFDLEGPDSHALYMPPAPTLASAQTAAEMVENYWMALVRDVPFANFGAEPGIAAACADLNRLSAYAGPRQNGAVTPAVLFRGNTAGDLVGPLLSQFFLQDMPYGAMTVQQRMATSVTGKDYMTTFDNWLAVQNGTFFGTTALAATPKYLACPRDVSQWVHVDAVYEAYLNACLVLLGGNYPPNPGNPYVTSVTQIGFGTFGPPHVLSLVTEVATRALKAVWYQKWAVHRRLRPEAYGGLVHLKVGGTLPNLPLHPDVLNSTAIAGGIVYQHNLANNQQFYNQNVGSYLLPQAFSEGSPTHPSYAEGHGTVAGACVTILKAWFDETATIDSPVMSSADGSTLIPYTGPALTVGGELNKTGSNVALGRCMAGVHYRSDYYQGILLGEAVAIGILKEQKATFNEPSALTFTKFDGTTITI